ncbi:vacuolar-type H+-ATPase subunit I/STV1 [Hymenobacter luteus]|uniref:Vacuolar-type H+-ATPase subunit I/STV1 n=2 Tax=Hymenobacter TaxID=89966 RepID=A0A7W9SZP5_9BACT|nr:vacuolar-type H+-ATPase subunit I/STV1 [Hymenobacter latericoloratus]MBB6058892.1 vacuolar-type H+-ATPase subunit I/STV1 [Hymenobacter luteus]
MANVVLDNWGVVTSVVGGGVAVLLYFVKSWRDVEELKEHRRKQETQTSVLTEKVDNYHTAAVAREAKHQQAYELKLQEHRSEVLRELGVVRKEGADAVLRLNEKVDALDKLLTVMVERQNQLLDASRRQEARNERVDRVLWARSRDGPEE